MFSKILVIALIAPILLMESAWGDENSANVFSWSNQSAQVSIELSNLSYPTFIVNPLTNENIPIFRSGDTVQYSIDIKNIKTYTQEFLTWFSKKHPNQNILKVTLEGRWTITSQGMQVATETYNSSQSSSNMSGSFRMLSEGTIELSEFVFGYFVEFSSPSGYEDTDYLEFPVITDPKKYLILYKLSNKIPQVIQHYKITNIAENFESIPWEVHSTSDLEISPISLSPKVCKVISGYILIHKVGDCKILIENSGDSVFLPVAKKTIQFKVVKKQKNTLLCKDQNKIFMHSSKKLECPKFSSPL